METIDRGPKTSSGQKQRADSAATGGQGEAHRLLIRAAWGMVAMLIFMAADFLAFGCGQQSNDRVSSTPQRATAVAAQAPSGTPALPASVGGFTRLGREPNSEAMASVSADSLSPDVAASLSDAPVVPGTAIQITAQGSPDVVAVTLGDDAGSKQAFAYDSNADLWRAAYRVPVKAKADRPALSVTARNASGRWRRVWLFLDVAGSKADADSASSTPRQP